MRRLVLQYITALAHWGRPLPTPRATNSSELPNNACYTSCRSFASKDYDAQRKTVDLISIKFLSQFISLKRRVSQAPRAAIRQELCGVFFEYRCLPFSLVSTTRSFTSLQMMSVFYLDSTQCKKRQIDSLFEITKKNLNNIQREIQQVKPKNESLLCSLTGEPAAKPSSVNCLMQAYAKGRAS